MCNQNDFSVKVIDDGEGEAVTNGEASIVVRSQ